MKRLSYIVIIVMAILNLQACYDDKGHYDYTPSTIPTITGIPETCDAYFGSPLSIPVTITYPEAAWENVDYEWRVNLEVISTDKDLNLESVDLCETDAKRASSRSSLNSLLFICRESVS